MDRSAFQRYTNRHGESHHDADGADLETADDLGAFGWLRGTHSRAIMLEIRKRNGTRVAVAYAWIERIEFDPSEGITISSAKSRIRITGRNLNTAIGAQARLYECMTRQRVQWVQETEQMGLLAQPDSSCVIEAITLDSTT